MGIFKHTGLLGDIIYSLPSVRHLGGGTFLIDYSCTDLKYQSAHLNLKSSLLMADLLETQDYIEKSRIYKGEKVDYDLNSFRNNKKIFTQHIAISHWESLNINGTLDLSQPWFFIKGKETSKIVISRSLKRQGRLHWEFLRGKDCLFLGYEIEWKMFKSNTKINIPFYRAKNLIEFAEIISGCRLFVGNQSFGWALAEAMKKNRVLEVKNTCRNVLPSSGNGYTRLTRELVDSV